ncbi:3-oxoacyl-ACP reductase FabG [Serratia sp. AKBS12]|uniref:3-oxoacyl-ACP reductase FabG n=1 Tax=Serratia sp. AKBS12 TaxID=2974597 RepID=UPI0021660ECA|nr:3-oxoacyl-ACP reductase FabG [Serratia sp. AKBS12]MCS3405900.1 3-oxoacyl-ACP reductase FabG [Serratia sp. AKBS12]HEI8866662.1 3-oxoacyl-ACP reductase FabG [Serratia odorifera]
MRLQQQVAIVTGAARGIGKGIAEVLTREGALVVVSDVDAQAGEACVDALRAAGHQAQFVACNIADAQQVEALFDTVLSRHGRLDILVNNAGINRDAMLHNISEANWDAVIAVNLKGTFLCMQQAARHMRERGAGRIVNIASASWLGNVGQANYAASKAGVVGLTKTACRELARKGVTVNAICPGFIDSDMTRGVPEKVWQMMVDKIPAGYAGQASDVGECVAFLASGAARYINGEVINVGGGMVL